MSFDPTVTIEALQTGEQQCARLKSIVTALRRKDLRVTTLFRAGKTATQPFGLMKVKCDDSMHSAFTSSPAYPD
jgi:hypothetical protein